MKNLFLFFRFLVLSACILFLAHDSTAQPNSICLLDGEYLECSYRGNVYFTASSTSVCSAPVALPYVTQGGQLACSFEEIVGDNSYFADYGDYGASVWFAWDVEYYFEGIVPFIMYKVLGCHQYSNC